MVFKVASFPCSFFSCDLAGMRAVVAGALLPALPRGSGQTGGSREGLGQPCLPATCLRPAPAAERLCKGCMELQGRVCPGHPLST